MLVKSVMTRPVVTTEPHASVRSAEALMREGRFRHLPVVAHGRVVGIVSDRDVVGRDSPTVGEVMHAPVISVTPVEVAARLLIDKKIGALPVLGAAAQLMGIVSQTNLFEVLALLLGGNAPSTRLELRLVDLPHQLAQLTALAYEVRVPISSLVTLPASGRADRRVVVRIGTIQFGPFVAALHQAGIEVNLAERLELETAVAA
jgi:acetoin utilization protein AcuB